MRIKSTISIIVILIIACVGIFLYKTTTGFVVIDNLKVSKVEIYKHKDIGVPIGKVDISQYSRDDLIIQFGGKEKLEIFKKYYDGVKRYNLTDGRDRTQPDFDIILFLKDKTEPQLMYGYSIIVK